MYIIILILKLKTRATNNKEIFFNIQDKLLSKEKSRFQWLLEMVRKSAAHIFMKSKHICSKCLSSAAKHNLARCVCNDRIELRVISIQPYGETVLLWLIRWDSKYVLSEYVQIQLQTFRPFGR